ncbi:aminotransferase class V-fold PLP-dependent enzyme [Pseudidiomarina sediminum]|uniref:aminotransferase class V-fold PLP-dependent enzyme n=1 Tax=Pseudidiomarina sediminum TaxID=431675 RepID=UPI001C984995|nr:aminotransferase class V-fold PLP-dependent enzyme [Pseudidiomarina sediminum]MBY6063977.1 aminotransferase class V-fold PLP-dependent enzyme [Pseudidiomarina sediminum]
MSYKHHYQHFMAQHLDTLHCAPHSHHYWPDVTRAAQLRYWDDSAKGVDHKWGTIFGERMPAVQQLLAELLDHPAPEQFVFAGNTHELLYRVISCFDPSQPLRILTTDGEFHSFSRQVRRLEERHNVTVERVSCEPFIDFAERWTTALGQGHFDLIFCSQVFFNSAVVAPWVEDWLADVPATTEVVIDGYHGCGAIPTSLRKVADRIFYVAGSYKYLQGGEGCCFMSVPRATPLRPEYTGWFADFANLAKPQQQTVGYANDGMRFAGATMDFSALYRLLAVLEWWQRDQLTVAKMHAYIQRLQQAFLTQLDQLQHPLLNRDALLFNDLQNHGHFLTFELASAEQVEAVATQLQQAGIETDYRGRRLRFGFALYHDVEDYERLKKALS